MIGELFSASLPRLRRPGANPVQPRTRLKMNIASAAMTSMTRMVHNIVRLRPLLVSSEGIRGPGVASHPNLVAAATRLCPENPTDTNGCLGKSLGGERQPQERLVPTRPQRRIRSSSQSAA